MAIERDVENLLEQNLAQNGWIVNFQDVNKDVFRQKAKTDNENIMLSGLKPDFCLYFHQHSIYPEIVIETKKPNMNLSQTKHQALKYAKLLGSKIIILFDGIQTKTYWVDNQESLFYDGFEVNVIKDKNFYKKYIKADSNHYVNDTITVNSKEELINIFAFANQKLRKAGITKGMERFFEFSNLLFLKLISEENDIVFDAIPEHIKWQNYKNKEGEELLSYINDIVIPFLENTFNKQNEETLFSKLIIQDTAALKAIIDKLDKLNLTGIKTDIKGDAFEYFIQQYNTSNKDLGEYFTPRHIVNFLVQLANPKYGEKIYDPFCGTGGILISTFNYIKDKLKEQSYLTDAILKDLKENTVYGNEISANARIAKMNMILTGDGHSNIKQYDTLLNPLEKKFDVVITNIPFNLEGTATNLYSLLTNDGNSQSIQHIINSLNKKKTARAYVIVPESVLNNEELKNLRKYLIKNNLLKEIISLPVGVFLPYTEAKASVLVLQGFNNIRINKIKYTRIKNDGFTLTQRRRKILNQINDLEEYLSDKNYASDYIDVKKILQNKCCSFVWFKYFNDVTDGYVLLESVLDEEKIKNDFLYETVTISNSEFYGILSGEEYWGDSFISVTSKSNGDYKVIKNKSIAYNPSRANVGSLGINLTEENVAVSKMYVTFRIKNKDFLPEYVYLYLKSNEGVRAIKERSFGTVRQALRFSDLCTISIPKFSIERQKEIVKKARIKYNDYLKAKEALNSFYFFEAFPLENSKTDK